MEKDWKRNKRVVDKDRGEAYTIYRGIYKAMHSGDENIQDIT